MSELHRVAIRAASDIDILSMPFSSHEEQEEFMDKAAVIIHAAIESHLIDAGWLELREASAAMFETWFAGRLDEMPNDIPRLGEALRRVRGEVARNLPAPENVTKNPNDL